MFIEGVRENHSNTISNLKIKKLVKVEYLQVHQFNDTMSYGYFPLSIRILYNYSGNNQDCNSYNSDYVNQLSF